MQISLILSLSYSLSVIHNGPQLARKDHDIAVHPVPAVPTQTTANISVMMSFSVIIIVRLYFCGARSVSVNYLRAISAIYKIKSYIPRGIDAQTPKPP